MATTTTVFLPYGSPIVTKAGFASDAMQAWMRLVTAQAAVGPNTATAAYFVQTADASLPNARVATDSATVMLDYSTPGQVKWNATGGGTVTHTAGALALNELVLGNGGADIKTVAATDGQVPIGMTADGSVTLATLTAGSGITITNGPGAITIATAGGLIADYVVMSNGANPPTPMDDGAGNFIYVGYTP